MALIGTSTTTMAAENQSCNIADIENTDQKVTDTIFHKKTFTLEILQLVKDSQQQHGLRHGDYQRYRSYCTKRIRRIRKSLHFIQGTKHRFHPKKVTEDVLTDVRYLYLPLMLTERAWAYAMQLKHEANTEPRKRFHLIRRLQKAVKHAEELEQLCSSSKCDARTKLESQAYTAWIQGSLNFELQQWQPAMECFGKSQTIYGKLASALSEDDVILYKQRVDELSPNIRYCAYNIGDESAINDLVQMRLSGKSVGEDILAGDLDHLISQTREKQAATLSEVTWLGRTVPVKQEKVRVFLLNAQEVENEVKRAPDLTTKIEVYERLLMECKDALQILRDELKSDQSFKTRSQAGDGSAVSSLAFLHSYLSYIRLSKTVDRNLLMIDSLRSALSSSDERNGDGKKKNKPQDLIRPYEIIIQNLKEIIQLPGIDPGSQFVEKIQAEILAYKAIRCYYIAQTFSAAHKWTEAMALYQRVEEYTQHALTDMSLNKELYSSLKEIQGLTEGCKYSAHAMRILGSDETTEKTSLKDKKMLIERLDQYCEDQTLLSRQPNLAPFPPDFKPIPCKPLFFDLALNYVEFPSLEEHLEQKKGGGIGSFVRGWLGGWKK
ncbi:signal recognition particle 68 [Tachypleus tridentatus]|uniref:signal recognition particle 68 n=1 Tax=Tachypleus tridentatus TaxID=6853 RepID=UPI003FD5DD4C